jgi:hypothetical protein
MTADRFLERSKALSQTANERSRAGAQACILINGGAATAVIAYLSKDKIDPAVVPDITYSLAGYAIGVLFAVLMFLFVTQCLENWNLYWLARAGELENPKAFERKAGWWWSANIFAAFVTVGAFCGASIWLARVLARMPVGIPSCGIG